MNTTPNITVSLFPDHASATAASLVYESPASSELLEMVDNQNKKDENTELECYSHDEDGYNSGSDCETYAGEEQIECKVYDDKHIHDEKTIDYFIDENIWDKIGKELKDYDDNDNDMDMLKWMSIEDCIEFY